MAAFLPSTGSSIARSSHEAADRLHFLDVLRGVAALAVFFAHAGGALFPGFNDIAFSLFDLGNFGVVLFFLCSGYIIPVSLERQGSLRIFWARRFFRLFPLYWLSITLVLINGYTMDWRGFPASFFANPLGYLAANTTMLQTLFGYPHMIGLAWTLMFEILFYIIVSAQFLVGLIKHTVPIAIGMMLSALLVEGIVPLIGGVQLPNGILSFFGTMCMGTLLYRYANGEISRSTLNRMLALALVMETITLVGDLRLDGQFWLHWLTARLAAYSVFIAVHAARRRVVNPALCYVGLISYSIYLMHAFVIESLPAAPNPWFRLCFWFALLLLVASATYRWVEQPGIRIGRHLSRRSAHSAVRATTGGSLSLTAERSLAAREQPSINADL
jgi:peptidoglycan/LPS O-acetylase OafA/YrhL